MHLGLPNLEPDPLDIRLDARGEKDGRGSCYAQPKQVSRMQGGTLIAMDNREKLPYTAPELAPAGNVRDVTATVCISACPAD